MTFAEAAARGAGLAGVAFGWTPEIFWNATPAELMALVRAAAPETEDSAGRGDLSRLMEAFPDG